MGIPSFKETTTHVYMCCLGTVDRTACFRRLYNAQVATPEQMQKGRAKTTGVCVSQNTNSSWWFQPMGIFPYNRGENKTDFENNHLEL